MSAFERAWALLKMAIVPGSVKHTGTTDDETDEYEAEFEHPDTGEIHPMRGDVHEGEANTFIFNPGAEPGWEARQWAGHRHGPIGDSNFSPRTDKARDAKTWQGRPYIPARETVFVPSSMSREGPESKPVGMGSALYDLAAIMARKRAGAKIVPSGSRSVPALNMWAKHEGKGHWPVNEELIDG